MWDRIIHNLTITEAKQLTSDEYYTMLAAGELIAEQRKKDEENAKKEAQNK